MRLPLSLLARLVAAFGASLVVLGPVFAAREKWSPIAPIHAPFKMPQLQRPDFPDRQVNILDYGAIPGGEVKNTAAIASAIVAIDKLGGGRVLIPAGVWLTGPVHLRSNIELHLAESAVLKFSDVMEDYLPNVFVRVGGIELYNYSPFIYARGCENIGITGPGRLDGNSQAWWDWKTKETREFFAQGAANVPAEKRVYGTREAAIRPSFVSFVDCKNILMEGFTIGGGPNWTIHPIYSENIIIRKVNVLTEGPNNDGIDPDSCRNVLIEHCTFSTGDDCVVLKSGYDQDGRRVGRPTENVVMRHCSAKRGHGGLVIGSEMSGSVRNVYLFDSSFEGTDRILRIKSRPGRGGVVENVWVDGVRGQNLKREAVILNMDYTSDPNAIVDQHPPIFRNIHVKNLVANGAPVAIRITGMESSPIQDVSFENVTIISERGVVATHARGLQLLNLDLKVAKGPRFEFEHVTGAVLDGVPLPLPQPPAPPAIGPSR
jgi:polygalacturonase